MHESRYSNPSIPSLTLYQLSHCANPFMTEHIQYTGHSKRPPPPPKLMLYLLYVILWAQYAIIRLHMSCDMGFPTMCYVRPAKPQIKYAQSDQSLCKSLEYFMSVKLLTEHHLECLSLKGGCTGLSESALVKMPHCWKSHITVHIFLVLLPD